jgi:hypothetical protein
MNHENEPGLPEHFSPVCRYLVHEGTKQVEHFDNDLWEKTHVIYARVFEERPVYIGSTDRSLRKRINEHLTLNLMARNRHYWDWAEGKRITIFAYKPEPVELLGRRVEVHRALEAALIAEFRPNPISSWPWFVRRAP